MGLSFSQNPLILPSLDVEGSGSVTMELLQGFGEIIAEDTNNDVIVQVVTHMYTEYCMAGIFYFTCLRLDLLRFTATANGSLVFSISREQVNFVSRRRIPNTFIDVMAFNTAFNLKRFHCICN